MVVGAAAKGDAWAIHVVEEAAHYLGMAIATVINLFNPSLVLLGGEILEAPDLFLKGIRDVVDRSVFSIPAECVEIVPSSLGSQAAPIGAASLVLDEFFSSEQIVHECIS
jgi:predicted NBD/HSP70 family sugar kinase